MKSSGSFLTRSSIKRIAASLESLSAAIGAAAGGFEEVEADEVPRSHPTVNSDTANRKSQPSFIIEVLSRIEHITCEHSASRYLWRIQHYPLSIRHSPLTVR